MQRLFNDQRVWLSLVVLPIAAITILVARYGVHVPFWDSWEMVPLFQKHTAGTLSFNDFWMQHNEHRVLFPNLLLYGLAMLTHWDPYYELFLNLIFAIGTLIILTLLINRTVNIKGYLKSALILLTACLVLSPMQSENWLWGWQVEWYLSVLGVVFALWCITAKKLTTKMLILGMVSATIATYSLGNGLIVWIVGLLLLLLRDSTWRQRLIWAGAGVIETALYYHNYTNPAYEPSKTLWLHHLAAFSHYVAVYLGRPLGPNMELAAISGVIVLVAFVTSLWYLWQHHRKVFDEQIVWFGIGLYALLSSITTAISRMGFGADQAFSSRYATISTLFTISTIVLTATAIHLYCQNRSHKSYRVLIPIGLSLVFVAYGMNFSRGVVQLQHQHATLVKGSQCLQAVQTPTDPCLDLTYPNRQVAWERLQYLRSKGWGGF